MGKEQRGELTGGKHLEPVYQVPAPNEDEAPQGNQRQVEREWAVRIEGGSQCDNERDDRDEDKQIEDGESHGSSFTPVE